MHNTNLFIHNPILFLPKILRLHQWVKNSLLFLPIFAAHQFTEINNIITLLIAFFAFSFCSSSVYIINDLSDIENDRLHPTKYRRPFWYFNHPEFYDWVFDTIKPTFIFSEGFFTYITAFELDPRFSRDYVPIDMYEDQSIKSEYHRDLHSGTFVRRDAIPSNLSIDDLRKGYKPPAPSKSFIQIIQNFWQPYWI